MNFIFLFALISVLISCKRSSNANSGNEENIVAIAGEEKLTKDYLDKNYAISISSNDTSDYAQKIIENWAKEALFYQEAEKKLGNEELVIEEQIAAYKKDLVNHIYQTKIIEANLDTVINNEEILLYYNEHKDNFILKENIVKVNYIKIPLKATGLEKIKALLYSQNPNDFIQLKTLCTQQAENSFLNDSTWLFLDDIKKEIPALREQPDFTIQTGRIVQYNDADYFYYLRVKDVKVKNSLSPINFEKQNIKKFIINNRKTQLINQYKQLLLEKAKSAKEFEVMRVK